MLKLRKSIEGVPLFLGFQMRTKSTINFQRSLVCCSTFNRYTTAPCSFSDDNNSKIACKGRLQPFSKRAISIHQFSSRRHFSTSNDPNNISGAKKSSKISLLTTVGLGASLLIGKTKYLFVALKLTKAAPLISMVLSSFAYSFIFGWPYAIGMVGLFFAHESGHALMMLRYGRGVSAMIFIPFIGAGVLPEKE
eukprot:gene27887-36733_t